MTKVAIAFLTKDRVELTKQTIYAYAWHPADMFWIDGSTTDEGRALYIHYGHDPRRYFSDIRGGADAAIVFALTTMLADSQQYDVIGLHENDVLLERGWFDATMALFDLGDQDGLKVGAVSPRCYEDRVLIQRDNYAVMHNLGAGIVLFTREAAQLILANYRTGWWHDSRALFAQLSGLDIGRWAAFRGNEQWTTADWHFDSVLAQAGLCSLALTPCMTDMIGQEPSLEEQGLVLARGPVEERRDRFVFENFRINTAELRKGNWRPDAVRQIQEAYGTHTYFAHQLANPYFEGGWQLQWSQGFGPFAYRANAESKLHIPLFGPVTFLVSGGKHGARVTIIDTESGYEIKPDLPAGEGQIAQLQVPGGMAYREIVMTCSAGAVFYGVQTVERQPITNQKFDYHSLPPV